MRIGIDLDDTTFILVEAMLKYADKYNVEILGRNEKRHELNNMTTHKYLNVLYQWDDETKFKFFDMFYANILTEAEISPKADEVIRDWKKQGHQIYFISRRLENIENCDAMQITKNSLEKYQIPYDEIILNTEDKTKVALEKKLDIFIDDSYDICLALKNVGIKTYLMTSRLNQNAKAVEVQRTLNWNHLKELVEKQDVQGEVYGK